MSFSKLLLTFHGFHAIDSLLIFLNYIVGDYILTT